MLFDNINIKLVDALTPTMILADSGEVIIPLAKKLDI
jgi:hypothetical protein